MLTFTDRAREMLGDFLDEESGGLELLRIHVSGSPMAPEYELSLVSTDERRSDEREVDVDGIRVLLAEDQQDRLRGATIDFVESVNESGFQVQAPTSSSGPESTRPAKAPEGPIADRVREVLVAQVNPAIASHGGAIELVDVQDTEIYLEMTGGCQGCAMSRLTLRQGVERMLREAIPELTAVHDVTDHASGDNPYFSA
jgi:Fe/S biogenesis protein NfuA